MVRAKKYLGQHFLKDTSVAARIAESLQPAADVVRVLEIGPGTGVLTRFLLANPQLETWCIEIDAESVAYLKQHFPELGNRLIQGDFLTYPLAEQLGAGTAIIGNFPYHISTQIVFRIIEQRQFIPVMCGMFQKEVAVRITSPEGSRDYGILSVLTQLFYRCQYLFSVPPGVFHPPPKVQSGVMRMERLPEPEFPVPYEFIKSVVKTAFNQRRKTMRNSLQSMRIREAQAASTWLEKRPEQISPAGFVELAEALYLSR